MDFKIRENRGPGGGGRLLRDGPRRLVELREQIGVISSKVLTGTLRRLRSHGLVVRHA